MRHVLKSLIERPLLVINKFFPLTVASSGERNRDYDKYMAPAVSRPVLNIVLTRSIYPKALHRVGDSCLYGLKAHRK